MLIPYDVQNSFLWLFSSFSECFSCRKKNQSVKGLKCFHKINEILVCKSFPPIHTTYRLIPSSIFTYQFQCTFIINNVISKWITYFPASLYLSRVFWTLFFLNSFFLHKTTLLYFKIIHKAFVCNRSFFIRPCLLVRGGKGRGVRHER